MKKKAQFRNMETIIITIVLTILFISGYTVYSRISYGNWEQKQDEIEAGRRAQINTLISNLPELKCTTLGVEEVSCIDLLKVYAFIDEYEENPKMKVYDEVFGNVEIVLEYANLGTGTTFEVPIFNASIEDYSSKTPVFNPILVSNPINGSSDFGMLITTFYER